MIKFKAAARAEAGKAGGGLLKYHAIATNRRLVGFTEIAKRLSKRSSISEPDIMAVLTGLSNILTEILEEGDSVQLDRIGIFSTSLKSEGMPTPEKVTASTIKEVRINFRPAKLLKDSLVNCKFEKVK